MTISCWKALLVYATFVLVLLSQLYLSPLGEGMDWFGHYSYITFVRSTGTAPSPQQLSITAADQNTFDSLPGPDQTENGSHYRQWRDDISMRERAFTLLHAAPQNGPYTIANYQAQHPPVYYFLIAAIGSWLNTSNIAESYTSYATISILLAALAIFPWFLIMRGIFGEAVAILGCLCIAWYPNFMPFLARTANDTLAFPLLSWASYFSICKPTRKINSIAACFFLGLAFATKAYALAFIPFVILSPLTTREANSQRMRSLLLRLVAVSVFLAPALIYNFSTGGSWLLNMEVLDTSSFTFSDKLTALFSIDPVWFFLKGLLRLGIWSGFWSFIAPPFFFFLLFCLPLLLFLNPRVWNNRGFCLQIVPIVMFIGAMAWHAALFALRAKGQPLQQPTGNEGWYLNILVPNILLAAIISLIQLFPVAYPKILATSASIILGLNLLVRFSLAAFWSGCGAMRHFLRHITLTDSFYWLSQQECRVGYASLPGVKPLLGLLCLVAAITLTVVLFFQGLQAAQSLSTDTK